MVISRYRHRKGHYLWGHVTVAQMRDSGGVPIRRTVQVIDITERKRMEAALQRSQRELQSLAGMLLNAAEDERARLARELHDDFNQRLAALGIELARLEDDPACESAGASPRLKELRDCLESLSDDIRGVAYRLHPARL